jgi:hypothetical protein
MLPASAPLVPSPNGGAMLGSSVVPGETDAAAQSAPEHANAIARAWLHGGAEERATPRGPLSASNLVPDPIRSSISLSCG